MKGIRINRILFLFFFLVAAMLVGARLFVQSEFLGKYLSNQVHEIVKNKIGADVKFSNIEIGFFPPATYLRNTEFKMNMNADSWVDLRAELLGVSFSIVDLLKKELSINEISLDEAEIFAKVSGQSEKSDEKKNLDVKYLFSEIKGEALEKLPITVRSVMVTNTLLFLNDATVSIEELYAANLRKSLRFSGHLKSIKSGRSKIDQFLKRDSIIFDLEMTEDKLRLVNIEITDKLNKLRAHGEINENLESGIIKLNLDYSGGVEDIISELTSDHVGVSGYVELKANLSNKINNPIANIKVHGTSIKSPYINADEVMAEAELDDKKITIKKGFAKKERGEVRNREPIVLELPDVDVINLPLTLKNVNTNDALYAVPDLVGLKGYLSGDVNINITRESLTFQVAKDSKITSPKYIVDDSTTPIISPKDITLDASTVVVDLIQEIVFLNLRGKSGETTHLNINGKIQGKKIDIRVDKGEFNFEEFGPIVGFPIIGKGIVGLEVLGSDDGDVEFIADMDLEEFSVLNFRARKIRGIADFNLNKVFLKLRDIVFDFDNTYGVAEGFINFNSKAIDLGFDFEKTSYRDIQYIVEPFFKEKKIYLPENVRSNVKAKLQLSNTLDNLIVTGQTDTLDMDIGGETFENGFARLKITDKEIFVDDIRVQKGQGDLSGNIHLYEGEIDDVVIRANDYRLRDIDLYRISGIGLDGQINGRIEIRKLFGEQVAYGDILLKNSNIANVQVDDSFLQFNLKDKVLNFNSQFIGDNMSAEGSVNLSKELESKVNLKYDFTNLRELFGIISEHNISDQSLSGRIKGETSAQFKIGDIEDMDLNVRVDELSLKRGASRIALNQPFEMRMNKGVVESAYFRLNQNNKNITTRFSGNMKNGVRIEQSLNIDGDWLELISPKIYKVAGDISGRGVITASTTKFENFYELEIKNGSLRIANVPNVFSDLEGKVTIDGTRVLIQDISANYGGGAVLGDGVVNIDVPFPEVQLNYQIQDSYLPLFKKSGALISAEGSLSGKRIPYILDGRVSIKGGSFKDEFSEFTKSEIIPSSVYQFIPEKRSLESKNLIDLNLQLGVSSPVYIENSLSELQFSGNARVSGDLSRPLVDGDFVFIQALSKFKFKGHEFVLQEGRVSFESKDQSVTPDLFFVASSQVNQYDIKLEVRGKANNLDINLTSEPYLVQEDILSLLTLGVTSDISQGLQSRERENVTTLGLSTLLVDQLKINEGLNSSLGLRLSVLPEFGENEQTLLQGKSGVSDGEVSRYKSATKVKIQKNISEKVDLSLSSTIGGSLEQKQEMNLNFNINKNLSVEGVYELKSSSEETIDTPDSVGADIKYKWSF